MSKPTAILHKWSTINKNSEQLAMRENENWTALKLAPPHLSQDVQCQVPMASFCASADGTAVGDHVRGHSILSCAMVAGLELWYLDNLHKEWNKRRELSKWGDHLKNNMFILGLKQIQSAKLKSDPTSYDVSTASPFANPMPRMKVTTLQSLMSVPIRFKYTTWILQILSAEGLRPFLWENLFSAFESRFNASHIWHTHGLDLHTWMMSNKHQPMKPKNICRDRTLKNDQAMWQKNSINEWHSEPGWWFGTRTSVWARLQTMCSAPQANQL